ncbi:MAG: dTDP-4-dehydrorhamnose 3,5-epimerase [Clostridiales bacterium]|nr:dTDP-4-dehydrorhamnose 3,5-epimerase [Clostridiales bacterium]
MRYTETELSGVILLEPARHGDSRGWFCETYSKAKLAECGITCDFVQDNESFTAQRGTLRGLHFQNIPAAQAKLVRVLRGEVYDVAVDLRRGSPRFGKWVRVHLSAENGRQLFVPRGFGHGFVTLTDAVLFSYKVDSTYAPALDRGIRFNDPLFDIDWGVAEPILSEKDKNAPFFADGDCNFVYGEEL